MIISNNNKMANLINVYYINDENKLSELTKNIVPGDIFILGNFKNSPVLVTSLMKKIFIVNLERDIIPMTKICNGCYTFHITDLKYKNILGNHWKKYKRAYIYNLGLPIQMINKCIF